MTTPSPHNLETTLRATEPLSLSTEERRELKTSLMTYANYHPKAAVPNDSGATSWPWWRSLVASGLASLVILTTTVNAASSLPGELLYPLKIQVVEPLTLPLQHPELNDLTTHTFKLERRLSEVKTLQREGTLSVDATNDVVESITDHTQALIDTVTDPEAPEADSVTLNHLDTAVALIDAHETLLASSTFAYEALTDVETSLDNAYEETVADLAEDNATTTIASYIDTSLDNIETGLLDTTLSSTSVASIESFIETASSSLAESDLIEAHGAISEANQLILTDNFVDELPPTDTVAENE